MSSITPQNQPLTPQAPSRHTRRRNPASRPRESQTTPPSQPQTQDPSTIKPQHVSQSSKPASRSTYKPEPEFNVHDIVPTTKSSKSLSKLAEAASSHAQKLPMARIDDAPSPTPADIIQPVEPVHESTPKPLIGDPNKVMFVAYGIEAHITQALKNEICWKFVASYKYCPHGPRCVRVHPIDKKKYLEQAKEGVRRYGEEMDKAKARALEGLASSAPQIPASGGAASTLPKAPAQINLSSSTTSSTSSPSSPSAGSLSLSSITTVSSGPSLTDLSTATSGFNSDNSITSSLSSSSSVESSPKQLIDSPLDTPTLNSVRISQEKLQAKPSETKRGSGSSKAPKFYSATISGTNTASDSCSHSGGLSRNAGPSESRTTSQSPAVPQDKLSNSSALSLSPLSRPGINAQPSVSHNHAGHHSLSLTSVLQDRAAHKLVNGVANHESLHCRQHIRDNSLPASHAPSTDRHEYRNRPQSTLTATAHPLSPRPPVTHKHPQPNNPRQLHTVLDVILSATNTTDQRYDASSPHSLNNGTPRRPEQPNWKTNQQGPNTNTWGHNVPYTTPPFHQRYHANSVPSTQLERRTHFPDPQRNPIQQPFNNTSFRNNSTPDGHPSNSHPNSDHDKPYQRAPLETITWGIPDCKGRATFGPGFSVVDVVTGMDTCWLYIDGLPARWSGLKILDLLKKYGDVCALENLCVGRSGPPVKAQYVKESGALNAMRNLQGQMFEGRKVEISLGLKTGKNKASVIRDMTVQVDITIPYVNVWVGYETEEASLAAIEKSRTTPLKNFWVTAEPFQGTPAVGFKTVKFTVPGFIKPDDMKVFGENEGVVTALSYRMSPYPTMEAAISGFERLLKRNDADYIPYKVQPGPYRNGFIRFTMTCSDGATAHKLAQRLDRRWINDVAKVYSRRVFTTSMTLERPKYQKSAAQIADLAWTAKKLGPGNSVFADDRGTLPTVDVILTSDTNKSLGLLKSHLDKTLNGTLVTGPSGHRLWDDSFEYGQGVTFVRDLERRFSPVTVRRDLNHRNIRVFGPEAKALQVRRIIEQKITDLQKRAQRSIPLHGALWAYFCEGPFQDLEDELGPEAIQLEYGTRLLHVRGDESVYLVAALAVKEARRKLNVIRNGNSDESDCPACFNKVENPVKLLCGHEYCRDCLQQYLNTAVVMKFFPLSCHGNGGKCNEKIALEVARRILTPSQWNDVVGAAFKAHVQQHPVEFRYCPTPDCNEVYRPVPEGIVYNCPSCFSRICGNCNHEAHEELTCAQVKEGVGEYRVWAEKNQVKQCPKCKVGIEKAAGCNHMTCTICKTHICWVCLQTFPDGGSAIYDHMRDNHGGMGLVPDVEEAN